MIKAIIFDFGGVVRSECTRQILEDISKKFNVTYNEIIPIIKELTKYYQLGKISDEEFWDKFSKKLGKAKPEDYKNLWVNEYAKGSLNKEVVNIIIKLKKRGYKMACLSNNIPPHAKFNRKMGNYDFFDFLILSCEIGLQKPDLKIYKLVLKKLKEKANACVYVDDKEEFLEPAERLGMKTILFKDAEQLNLGLKKIGIRL